jgi:isopentenyl-diphosphate delta-isomerase
LESFKVSSPNNSASPEIWAGHVVLVDADDRALGTAPKLAAHQRGLRHRAVSVMVFDSAGRLIIQRRHPAKYHSGDLWANTCCTHPGPDEAVGDVARSRLVEEMGISCPVELLFTTSYREEVSNNLIEDEVVHVFAGRYDGPISPNKDEVSEWNAMSLPELITDQHNRPEAYAPWFLHYLRTYRPSIENWLAGGPRI